MNVFTVRFNVLYQHITVKAKENQEDPQLADNRTRDIPNLKQEC